ncbi:MAG: FAD-binding oxidoreductase [Phycisphaerae bacterium]|nr:FAD-binding oxidoreductase [Phycisphaerae bacterium]
MDLHTGRPIWFERQHPTPIAAPPLARNDRCGVAVIGGGITGALLVDRLCDIGVDAMLLDSRDFGSGSSLASTGLLLPESDTHFFELEGTVGADGARRVYELGVDAIGQLEALADHFSGSGASSCEFARRSSVYLASDERDVALLEREVSTRERLGLPAERLTSRELRDHGYSFEAPLALRSPVAGEINTYSLTLELLRRAGERGLRAHTARVVSHAVNGDGHVELQTDGGHVVRADSVVYASGYESHAMHDERLGSLASTWVFVSDPLESLAGWPDRAVIWESARPYVYLRTTLDNRVMMGGGDDPSATAHCDESLFRAKVMELTRRFAVMFPQIALQRVDAWAGVFGSSSDGLPYIGRPDPGVPIYGAFAYGGNGITFSVIATDILAAALSGRRSADAHLFRFGR